MLWATHSITCDNLDTTSVLQNTTIYAQKLDNLAKLNK